MYCLLPYISTLLLSLFTFGASKKENKDETAHLLKLEAAIFLLRLKHKENRILLASGEVPEMAGDWGGAEMKLTRSKKQSAKLRGGQNMSTTVRCCHSRCPGTSIYSYEIRTQRATSSAEGEFGDALP